MCAMSLLDGAFVCDFLMIVWIALPFYGMAPVEAPRPLWDSLKRVALRMEVVGPEEVWRPNFSLEMEYVHRYLWIMQGWPHLREAAWLPIICVADNANACNREYYNYVKNRRPFFLHRVDMYDECLAECVQLARIWELVSKAANESEILVSRRRALRDLRMQLGDKCFQSGELPPAVPLWRFVKK